MYSEFSTAAYIRTGLWFFGRFILMILVTYTIYWFLFNEKQSAESITPTPVLKEDPTDLISGFLYFSKHTQKNGVDNVYVYDLKQQKVLGNPAQRAVTDTDKHSFFLSKQETSNVLSYIPYSNKTRGLITIATTSYDHVENPDVLYLPNRKDFFASYEVRVLETAAATSSFALLVYDSKVDTVHTIDDAYSADWYAHLDVLFFTRSDGLYVYNPKTRDESKIFNSPWKKFSQRVDLAIDPAGEFLIVTDPVHQVVLRIDVSNHSTTTAALTLTSGKVLQGRSFYDPVLIEDGAYVALLISSNNETTAIDVLDTKHLIKHEEWDWSPDFRIDSLQTWRTSLTNFYQR